MEKSKTLFTREDVERRSEEKFGFAYTFFGSLFFILLYLAVVFCLIASIFLFATHELMGVAWAGLIIFKFWVSFWICFVIVIFAKWFYKLILIELILIRKIKFQERREQLKKELIQEIENGRRSKARQPRKESR